MMEKERGLLDLFEEVTHGQVVSRVLRRYGQPDALHFYDVDNMRGAVVSEKYLDALARTKRTLQRRQGDRVVVNISLGSPIPKPKETQLIADILGLGGIVVAAAGNDGTKESTYPAVIDGVICVGASGTGIRRTYSNYGNIDIFASGRYRTAETVSIPSQTGLETRFRTVELKGTSFAAPKVSGVIVKMLQMDPSLEAAQILEILQKTSDNVLGFEHGAVNRLSALAAISETYAMLKKTRYTFFMGLQVACILVLVCAGLLLVMPVPEFLFRVWFPQRWVAFKMRKINRIRAAGTPRPRAIRYLINCLFPGYSQLFECASRAIFEIGEPAVPELTCVYPYKPCNEFGDFATCVYDLIAKIGGKDAEVFLRAEQERKDALREGTFD
ncbi:MAG: S8 family serine peptidase [Planctomycetes bacterium]|nr:S8 family serine peptidase [Planctomycetota bacterium]